jgi:hypothetical protein
MHHFEENQKFFNKPILTGTQDPFGIIRTFFEDIQMYEVRQRFWNLVETAIVSDNIQFSEAGDRQSPLNFYNRIEELVEAAMKIDTQIKEGIVPSQEIE